MNFIKLAPKKKLSPKNLESFLPTQDAYTWQNTFCENKRRQISKLEIPSLLFFFLYFRHLETSLSSCQKLSAFFSNQILYLIKFVQMTAVKQNTQHQPGVICLLLPLHLCTNLTFDLWGHRSPHTLEHFFAESLKIILQTV